MSSGPKQPKETTQVVKNETIPDWLRPYVTDVAQRGQALSREAYQPYQGQRVAGFDPMQTKAFEQIGAMQRPGELGQAGDIYPLFMGYTCYKLGIENTLCRSTSVFHIR